MKFDAEDERVYPTLDERTPNVSTLCYRRSLGACALSPANPMACSDVKGSGRREQGEALLSTDNERTAYARCLYEPNSYALEGSGPIAMHVDGHGTDCEVQLCLGYALEQ